MLILIKTIQQIKVLLLLATLLLSTKLYALSGIKSIPERNPYFTGRLSYLYNIQKTLSQHGKVYLTGYGGLGKTQLAKEFCYLREQEYDLVWWFDLRNDLKIQYEILLTNLGNDKKFENLLHIKAKDIAPNVVIDFTNSLLEKCNCSWLLVFDNVTDNQYQSLKLPKTRTTKVNARKNIIITTRIKRSLGDNVLPIDTFSDKESEQFLFKIHPDEKKNNLTKLSRILHNYPLALAQVSENILSHKSGIRSYLNKHNEEKINSTSTTSDITQNYDGYYREVLNNILNEIEQKHKKSAEFLYMLALLKINLTKKLLYDIFDNKFENELAILGKHGIVQSTFVGKNQTFTIHDIIREEVIKKFNNKKVSYKKGIIHSLNKYMNNFYSEKNLSKLLNSSNIANGQLVPLYAFIDGLMQNNHLFEDSTIDLIIISLRLNNLLLNRYANYALYQEIAHKIYNKNLNNISPLKKASLFANLVFADFIFESEETLSKFENEMLYLLKIVENNKNYKKLFFIYTNLSKLYVFLGNLKEANKYIEKAKRCINYSDNIFDSLQYWYSKALLDYELRNSLEGIEAYDIYEKLEAQLLSSGIALHSSKNLRIRLEILNGQKDRAKKELQKEIRKVTAYYNNVPSFAVSYLIFTNALICFLENQYKSAYDQCNLALNIAKKASGTSNITNYIQANMHLMLGNIYEKNGWYDLALEEYNKCLVFYNKRSHGRMINLYEYGELLSNLCHIYYKLKDHKKSKFYFKNLVLNFDSDHKLVEKLIKKLPIEYMQQVNKGNA